ncbi:MAG: ABC transporter permease [Bacillota bacterium]|jgi:oligopeptide transport system permease protein
MRSSLRDRKSEKLAKKVTQYSAETMKRIQEIQELIDEPQELREQDDLTPEQVQSLSPSSFQKVSFNKAGAERTGFSNYSYWGSTLRMFMRNRFAVFLLILLTSIVVFTFIQPHLPGQYPPNQINNNPETGMQYINVPPGKQFWLGTNSIGQDLWARIWSGTRTSLNIGFTVAVADAVLGLVMGLVWGYVRKLDIFFTELYNIFSNIPQTIILILISYVMRPGMTTMIVAMAATGWLALARFIRNQTVIIRDRDYNLASRCLGTPVWRIIFKNLLPQMVSVVMLRMALSIPLAIGNEVFLTYIGLGLPITIPSLGNLINEGRMVMTVPALRFQLIAPALVLSMVTISFYLIGNAFSDAADPKNHV